MKSIEEKFSDLWKTVNLSSSPWPAYKKDCLKMFYAGFIACFVELNEEVAIMPDDMILAHQRARYKELQKFADDMETKKGLFRK